MGHHAHLLAVAATMVITAHQQRFRWRTIINVGGAGFVLAVYYVQSRHSSGYYYSVESFKPSELDWHY